METVTTTMWYVINDIDVFSTGTYLGTHHTDTHARTHTHVHENTHTYQQVFTHTHTRARVYMDIAYNTHADHRISQQRMSTHTEGGVRQYHFVAQCLDNTHVHDTHDTDTLGTQRRRVSPTSHPC